jgi:energy-coupling factor transporter ATP-binding protein EcfA2
MAKYIKPRFKCKSSRTMKTWYDQLGFRENPLDLRPCPKLVGLNKHEEDLKNHIRKGEICVVNGLTGSGKSSLLVKLKSDLKDHKFVYLDAQETKEVDVDEALRNSRSLMDKISLKKYPAKPAVLVIDEFQGASQSLVLQARAKWENPQDKKIKAIVISQISKQMKNVTPAFKERVGNRIVTLPTLDDSEMKEVLKLRLQSDNGTNYYNKLHNEAINLIVACSDGNPRRLLEYTDLLFDFHFRKFGHHNPLFSNKTYMINYYGAKEILELHGINTNAYKYLSPEEAARSQSEFDKRFNKDERTVLEILITDQKTMEEAGSAAKFSKALTKKVFASLKHKKAIEKAGYSGGKMLWQASQHAKRLKVNV